MNKKSPALGGAECFFVVALLLIAAGLRFTGLTYGQPDPAYMPSYTSRQMVYEQLPIQPDEYEFVAIPLEMAVLGQVDLPYEYPSLMATTNFLTYVLTGSAQGITPADRAGVGSRAYAPFSLYLIGRTYSALGGVLAVAAAYAVARQLAGRRAAAATGLLTAASMTLVQHGHYATSSSMSAGFAMLAAWAALASLRSKRYRWPLVTLAGAAVGLATSSRFNAAFVVSILALTSLVLLVRDRTRCTVIRLGVAWVAGAVAFLLGSPQAILGFRAFIQQMNYFLTQYLAGNTISANFVTFQGWFFEYRHLVLFGVGVPAALAVVLGVIWVMRAFPGRHNLLREHSPFLAGSILLAYMVIYGVMVLRTARPNGSDQLLVPFIPFVAIFAGIGAAWLIERLPVSKTVLSPVLMVALVVVPLSLSVQSVSLFTQVDTRYRMQAWVYDHLPRGAFIQLNGPYNVPLDEADYPSSQTFSGDLIPVEQIREEGFGYLILSDAYYWDVARSREYMSAAYREELRAYLESLDQAFTFIARLDRPLWPGYEWFTNTMSFWHQPGLTVYCLDEAACEAVR